MATLIGVVTTLSLKEADPISGPLLSGPRGLAVDTQGNIFVADTGNSRIRKITPRGEISTFAASAAKEPNSVLIDKQNNILFSTPSSIWKTTPSGEVTQIVGGERLFEDAAGFVESSDTSLLIADAKKHRILAFNTDTGNINTVAGFCGSSGFENGAIQYSRFKSPTHVAFCPDGTVLVLESHGIRKLLTNGNVSTFVGSQVAGFSDGEGMSAAFSFPKSMVRDPRTGNVFVTDDARIRCVTPEGAVFTIAGSSTVGKADGRGAEASFFGLYGLAIGPDGSLFVSDVVNDSIRKITLEEIPQADRREVAKIEGRGAAVEEKKSKRDEEEPVESREAEKKPARGRKQTKSAEKGADKSAEEPKKRAKKEAAEAPKVGGRSLRSSQKR